jgi:hypothetical protein
MNRGNTGMDIYRSERDREKFLEYVGEAVKRYGIKVHISGAGIAARHNQIAKKLETDRKLKGREHRIRRKIL